MTLDVTLSVMSVDSKCKWMFNTFRPDTPLIIMDKIIILSKKIKSFDFVRLSKLLALKRPRHGMLRKPILAPHSLIDNFFTKVSNFTQNSINFQKSNQSLNVYALE